MPTTTPNTQILFFDGVDDLDAVGPLEILTSAGLPTKAVRPVGHATTIHTAHGLVIEIPDQLDEAAELVIIPGGVGAHDLIEGQLPAQLAAMHSHGTVLASVCTGAMLLATAGLLRGRRAVTNRIALDDLAAAGACVHPEARVVDDGELLTCGGPAAGLDLGVHLVSRFLGSAAGAAAADRVDHHPVGPVLLPALTAVEHAKL